MDTREVDVVRSELASHVADVFASLRRKDQRAKSDCYLRGLMLDGRRKSIQAMAGRLPDGNEQNLQLIRLRSGHGCGQGARVRSTADLPVGSATSCTFTP